MMGATPVKEFRPKFLILDAIKEVIVRYMLDLDGRGFPSRLEIVQDMGCRGYSSPEDAEAHVKAA